LRLSAYPGVMKTALLRSRSILDRLLDMACDEVQHFLFIVTAFGEIRRQHPPVGVSFLSAPANPSEMRDSRAVERHPRTSVNLLRRSLQTPHDGQGSD